MWATSIQPPARPLSTPPAPAVPPPGYAQNLGIRAQSVDQRGDSDLQAGAGDSIRHRRGETRGYGSSARWAHGTREADR
jgi:hypothetical protein